MPRIARYIEPDGYYHVISRSSNEMWIFRDDSDFLCFLGLMRKAKEQFPIHLFHYCLMNTHFHFVAQVFSKALLGSHIGYLKWHYTMWMRKKYGWKGPLWRERYKSLPIENESYLNACGIYIENNPVRAGICSNPAEYVFSSARKYYLNVKDDLVDDYNVKVPLDGIGSFLKQEKLWKKIFSRAPAVGSQIFVQKYRLMKDGCPQK